MQQFNRYGYMLKMGTGNMAYISIDSGFGIRSAGISANSVSEQQNKVLALFAHVSE
jgi:hypothetical protein